jgi:hypothetical protein
VINSVEQIALSGRFPTDAVNHRSGMALSTCGESVSSRVHLRLHAGGIHSQHIEINLLALAIFHLQTSWEHIIVRFGRIIGSKIWLASLCNDWAVVDDSALLALSGFGPLLQIVSWKDCLWCTIDVEQVKDLLDGLGVVVTCPSHSNIVDENSNVQTLSGCLKFIG